MVKEFRNFINRGNVVELGVAFVMGASFKSLVDVFTKRLIEPLIGLIINLPNLDNLGLFGDVDPNSGLQSGSFGAFLGEIINYLIIAFVMFLVIRLTIILKIWLMMKIMKKLLLQSQKK